MIVVVMGVCGCGKSTVGKMIAARMKWAFVEGDDLHPPSNREKMASGKPLTDDDRWPWLDRIAEEMRKVDDNGYSAVIACSALRKVYRDRLRVSGIDVQFIHLTGDPDLILQRMQHRPDHFMPPGLLDSQLATLEPAGPDEVIMDIDVALTVATATEAALNELGLR